MSAFLFCVICGANKNIKLRIINFDNLNYCCIFATTKRVQKQVKHQIRGIEAYPFKQSKVIKKP